MCVGAQVRWGCGRTFYQQAPFINTRGYLVVREGAALLHDSSCTGDHSHNNRPNNAGDTERAELRARRTAQLVPKYSMAQHRTVLAGGTWGGGNVFVCVWGGPLTVAAATVHVGRAVPGSCRAPT